MSAIFGDLLLQHLGKRDRTNAWLAERLGVSHSSVARWVNGQTLPKSSDLIQRIADVLGIFNKDERMMLLQAAGYVVSLNADPEVTDTIDAEIAWHGSENVSIYLNSLAAGESAIRYEGKLLIVGEGGTGKSSVLRSLLNLSFDAHLPTTHGIDIQTYRFPHPDQADTEITLNVWDFGGQQIYHTTHQFFMTERSLYLLVWNARGDTEQGRLDHWLHNIEVLAPDAPVLLVATHIDERPANFNFSRFKAAYPQFSSPDTFLVQELDR